MKITLSLSKTLFAVSLMSLIVAVFALAFSGTHMIFAIGFGTSLFTFITGKISEE